MDIEDIIIKVKKIIKNDFNYNIKHKDLLILTNDIYIKLKTDNNISLELIKDILLKLTTVNYQFDNTNIHLSYFKNYNLIDNVIVPKEYIKLEKQFKKLEAIPQPEQKTKEWFAYRHERITASDTAEAIDLNPYKPVEFFILKKCDSKFKFLDNHNVYFGKKYEPIATLIYEHINNAKVVEFGALPSEKYPILGASPDGICSKFTLDNKFSELLGTMLEIKCTTTREIYTSGEIKGHICPFYYYCQVQQQLECCNLNVCDFWQCKIKEYENREDYLIDKCDDTKHTYGTNGEERCIDKLIQKGCLIKFLPKKFIPETDENDKKWEDNIEWKSKFIYPPKLNMNEYEYDNWCIDILANLKKTDKDLYENYYFDKIVYWKLEKSHNVPIKRDKQFFSNILPILTETWSKVIYYRKNLNKLDELKDIIKKRTKYIKFDTCIKTSNYLFDNKKLFLNNTKSDEKVLKKIINYDDEFLDDVDNKKIITIEKTIEIKKIIAIEKTNKNNNKQKNNYDDEFLDD
jgi:putative phage-type endonuclease